MSVLLGLFLFTATVVLMEAFAYGLHRFVMHSRLGWAWHQSHHRERGGGFEKNDLFAAVFALPSMVLIWGGVNGGWGEWATWTGAGVAFYGIIYFGFHDVIVHGRLPHRIVPRSVYFKRIVQAHKLHHAVESRDGGVSYGFLYAPPIEKLKRALKASAEARVRAAKGASTARTEERA